MQREHDLLLREHLRIAVSGHGAHISMSDALQGFPPERAGARVAGIHHSARDLVYHVDVVLHDLIDRAVADEYHPHEYPSGYRPQDHAPPSTEAWHVKLQALEDALATIRSWVDDETRDLLAPLDRGDGHTLFSADHARCGSHVVPLCANG
ncbi:MAG: hypothetical protein ACLFO1_08710 [Spirochaetaceae bacterium]